ncbi:nucleotidyltransferase [Jeotgalibaca porci]|uniref:nucleotidyltransferase n=1 Tax=Jeotgalibaca porci TaxID=1868793 RepID=UPI003F9189A1
MKSCGVVAEYNPFHNGHRFQLQQAREQSGADVMVVSMSGNFTQRGEPAIYDKWLRARMALENGADLVLEQSVLGSVQASDFFAKANVRLLHQMNCNAISFGAENGTTSEFSELAEKLVASANQIDQHFQSSRNDGSTYAAQMAEAIEATIGKTAIRMNEPNNQLALSYLKENLLYSKPMQPVVIQRKGAGHNDQSGDTSKQASGTYLRTLLLNQEYANLGLWVPDASRLMQEKAVSWDTWWPYLKYQIVLKTPDQLREIYQMEEGIEFRLKKNILEAETFTTFIESVKSKRWSWVRLQRLCVYILLGITREEAVMYFKENQPVRILGFTAKGRAYLKQIKNDETTFVTNMNKFTAGKLAIEIRSDAIYTFGHGEEQNFRRSPIIIP